MNKWVSPLTGQMVEQEVAEAHAEELRHARANATGDIITKPSHYQGKGGLEVITVIRAFGLDRSFELGSAVKYILRSSFKGSKVENIKKARQVLDMWLQENDKESN